MRAADGAGVRIGEGVAGRDVHQDEGREHDAMAAIFQIANGGDDGLVGWRAAVGRLIIGVRDDGGGGAIDARHRPDKG